MFRLLHLSTLIEDYFRHIGRFLASSELVISFACKDGLEMRSLAHVGDIDQPFSLLVMKALPNGCHVSGGISKATISLLDNERRALVLILHTAAVRDAHNCRSVNSAYNDCT